ncbi:uncharacterized protein LOC132639357 [Lycium barbarum]|uniref:uncharacterized protein LOC132639357 n=1 Tax=Lycium barbarum TaxID=112863 RepID=UPI00293ED7C3|nr:uncharacterized protein LOC132639357 [Lycium barbarum]
MKSAFLYGKLDKDIYMDQPPGFGVKQSKKCSTPLETSTRLRHEEGSLLPDPKPFRAFVGSLLYLTITRPDIAFSVGYVSRIMQPPRKPHLEAAKRILKYINSTSDMGLFFQKKNDLVLTRYTDADFGGDLDNQRSTSGYIFLCVGISVSWCSKKQDSIFYQLQRNNIKQWILPLKNVYGFKDFLMICIYICQSQLQFSETTKVPSSSQTIQYSMQGLSTLKWNIISSEKREDIEEIRRCGLNVAVAGIPKVIDKSFGFDSAVEEGQRAISAAHVEATSFENGICLVKLMGRDSGNSSHAILFELPMCR